MTFDEQIKELANEHISDSDRKHNEIQLANMPTIIREAAFIAGANAARGILQGEIKAWQDVAETRGKNYTYVKEERDKFRDALVVVSKENDVLKDLVEGYKLSERGFP